MKKNLFLVSFLTIFIIPVFGQNTMKQARPVIPMLKDGSPAAYVMFTRPKQTHGLALMAPEGSGVQSDVFMGHEGAMPAADSEDHALYFQTAADRLVVATGTFYLSIQYSDRGQGAIEVDYYQQPDKGTAEISTERIFLRNSRVWQEHTFLLRDAILDHPFPGECDFRIRCPGVVIRAVFLSRIPLTTPQPTLQRMFRQPEISPLPGYQFGIFHRDSSSADLWKDAETLQKKSQLYKAWGARYVVDTIDANQVAKESEGYDFTKYAERLDRLSYFNLVWVPRFKVGDVNRLPQSVVSHLQRAKGTERKSDGPMISLLEPSLIDVYSRMIRDMRQSILTKKIPMMILSFAGDWGPLYLSSESGQQSGWPDIWAGDPLAVRNFHNYLQAKYGGLQGIRSAWNVPIRNWNEVIPKIDNDANPIRRQDTYLWYQSALTRLAARMVQRVRTMFPGTQIVLEIGDNFFYGATDFRAFADIASQQSCSLLMVSQSFNPTASSSWQLVATACRQRGVSCGLRLAQAADERAILGALFSLAAEKGNLFFFEEDDLASANAWENYAKAVGSLRVSQPDRKIAMVFPRTSMYAQSSNAFDSYVREVREFFAFDVIDEYDLSNITSSQYPLIFIPWGHLWSRQAVTALENLARSGSALVARTDHPWQTLMGEVEFNEQLFATKLVRSGNTWELEPRNSNISSDEQMDPYAPAERRIINLGSQSDVPYLEGDWGAPQNKTTAAGYGFDFPSFRWLRERGQVMLPVYPQRDYSLIVEGFIPEDKKCQVYINGRQFGVIEGKGKFQWKQSLSGKWRPRQRDVVVSFRGQTWNPGAVLGATETFQVSMAVNRVALLPPDQELDQGSTDVSKLRDPNFTREALRGSWMREVGQGVTLLAPTDYMNDWVFMELLNTLVMNPKILDPRYSFQLPPDGVQNQVFVSPLSVGAVYLNVSQKPVPVGDRRMGNFRMIPSRSIYYTN